MHSGCAGAPSRSGPWRSIDMSSLCGRRPTERLLRIKRRPRAAQNGSSGGPSELRTSSSVRAAEVAITIQRIRKPTE